MKVSRPVVCIDDPIREAFRHSAERKHDRARRQAIATALVVVFSAMMLISAGERFGWGLLPVAFALLLILAIARWGTRA